MHIKRFLSTFFCLVYLISCSSSDDLDSFKDEKVDSYNSEINVGRLNKEIWTETPLLILNKLFPPDYSGEGRSTYKIEMKKDSIGLITFIITDEGLLDDSVYGEKRFITFAQKNGVWTITKIEVGYKCQKNRGHQNYSGVGCS